MMRRKKLMEKLNISPEPLTGSELSKELNVSRQVVVQDVALLRAKGEQIIATPQGYLAAGKIIRDKVSETIACRHNLEQTAEELKIIVAHGGTIVDVVVEHPIYGELQGMLMLRTIEDVEGFIEKLSEKGAMPLSALTNGVHLHKVEAGSQEKLDKIKAQLRKRGLLL